MHYHDERNHGSSKESAEDPTRSHAYSNGELSKNNSSEGRSLENYHLECYHIPKKSKAGFLAGKRHIIPTSVNHEPENLQKRMVSEMPCSSKKQSETVSWTASPLTLNFADIFPDDAIMSSYESPLMQDEEGLSFHNADAFEFGN